MITLAQLQTSTAPERWVTAAALKALADRALRAGATFTAEELSAWVPTLTSSQRVNASTRLCYLGFVTHAAGVGRADGHDVRQDVYTVTADGAAAIAAAAQGHVRKSGPKGTRKPHAPKSDAFVVRLWSLMRMRKMLDSDTAARTLGNAGADDYERLRGTARKYLKRWAAAGVVTESARRINAEGTSNGVKRYVLLSDPGPAVPGWTKAAQARKAKESAR